MLLNYKTRLSKKNQLAPDVYLFTFVLDEPKELVFIPGQYMILMVPQQGGESLRRLYSIASPNSNRNEFELLVKLIPNGKGSIFLSQLNIDDAVSFQGPAGMFTLRQTQKDKIFLMTGTGYAPGRSMILSLFSQTSSQQAPSFNTYLFWGIPTYKELYFFDELKHLAEAHPRLHISICLSREQNLEMIAEGDRKYFFLGHVTDGFDQLTINGSRLIADFDFYLCSGREIVESLKEYLVKKNAPKEQVFFEKF